jgi:aryl-alcohol dehydrogenase
LSDGRQVFDVIEGEAVPPTFIPHPIRLYRQRRFNRLVTFEDFADINRAIADENSGETIKAVIRCLSTSP